MFAIWIVRQSPGEMISFISIGQQFASVGQLWIILLTAIELTAIENVYIIKISWRLIPKDIVVVWKGVKEHNILPIAKPIHI